MLSHYRVTNKGGLMSKVVSEISMSLDGFITGPNVRVGNGMGDGGERLHDWRFDAQTETDAAIVDEIYASTGAVVLGKRMFEDRKSTRLNSSHANISYAVFCLKKKY